MLPRSSAKCRSGRKAASCARRRGAPVATVAPLGKSARRYPTRASLGSPRFNTAPIVKPSGVCAGISFAECTAISASPASTAACTSFTKTPFPPISEREDAKSRSPAVETITSSPEAPCFSPCCACPPGACPSSSRRTAFACQRASSLPRVAIFNSTPQVKQISQRFA